MTAAERQAEATLVLAGLEPAGNHNLRCAPRSATPSAWSATRPGARAAALDDAGLLCALHTVGRPERAVMSTLPSTPGTPGHVTSKRPTATEVPRWPHHPRQRHHRQLVRLRPRPGRRHGPTRPADECLSLRRPPVEGVRRDVPARRDGCVLRVTLDDSASEDLAEELDAARQQPDSCFYCDGKSVVVVAGIELCHEHARAKDFVELAVIDAEVSS